MIRLISQLKNNINVELGTKGGEVLQQNHSENKLVLRTRSWIFQSLILLMPTNEYKDLSITSIVEKAGVSRQSFYRNYKSKDDIIIKFFDEVFNDFLCNVQDNHLSASETYQAYFSTLYNHKDALSIIYNASLDYLIYKILISYTTHFKNNASCEYKDMSPILKSYIIQYQLGGLVSITMEWIKNGLLESPKSLGEITYATSVNTINDGLALSTLLLEHY